MKLRVQWSLPAISCNDSLLLSMTLGLEQFQRGSACILHMQGYVRSGGVGLAPSLA